MLKSVFCLSHFLHVLYITPIFWNKDSTPIRSTFVIRKYAFLAIKVLTFNNWPVIPIPTIGKGFNVVI